MKKIPLLVLGLLFFPVAANAAYTIDGVETDTITIDWDTYPDVIWHMRDDVGTNDTSGSPPYDITVAQWNMFWPDTVIKLWIGQNCMDSGSTAADWISEGCTLIGGVDGYTVLDGVWIDVANPPNPEIPTALDTCDLAENTTIDPNSSVVDFGENDCIAAVSGGSGGTGFQQTFYEYHATFPSEGNFMQSGGGLFSFNGLSGLSFESYGLGTGDYYFKTTASTTGFTGVLCVTTTDADTDWSIESCSILPAPATTEFNEVLDYIYDPDLNNSYDTSPVGASYNISEPEWRNYMGFKLYGPNGTLRCTGTSTAIASGLYTVDTDYYFDKTGSYRLQAFFNQTIGGVTQDINNTVSLYIAINAPAYAYDPVTGDLIPAASTTISTSTLENFKVTCPDDFLMGNICKLAVGLFIPKVSSMQALQGSFGLLMEQSPFNFFTQSKQILDALRTGDDSTGGSFAVTLYGDTYDVVSTTTAANIGLDENQLDTLKRLMIAGLWILFAWYLYWRIASIFGV